MDAVRAADWDAATRAARGSVTAQDLGDWHRLRAGQGTFEEYSDFLDRNADWPGLPLMRRRGEASIGADADWRAVLAYISEDAPQTAKGALFLAYAYNQSGRPQAAVDEIRHAWRTMGFSETEQALFLGEFRPLLETEAEDRLDMLLWRGRFADAERLLPEVSGGWRALTQARIALRRLEPGVDTLIAAVPKDLQSHPGLAYERFLWRIEKGRIASATELLLERSESAASLGQPERWARWRRYIVREKLGEGEVRTAYRLASQHHLTAGSNFADLEWLAGYIALRKLDDPVAAAAHFQHFRSGVKSPISLGRAGYWEGRALEAAGRPDEAAVAYAFGAEFQTSFYGLLAAERAGLPMDPRLAGTPPTGDWREAEFASSSVLKAAMALLEAGETDLSERFFVHLAESLNEVELAQLGELALSLDEPHLAVMIGKQAARMGHVLPRPYFPVALPREGLPVDAELALAIIRRESEFDPTVTSPAGARGLMQLMPGTAKEVSSDLGLSYSADRLLTDPSYNAILGSTYLQELEERYDGNIVLVAAAYNAGPSRADRWKARFGDPRDPSVDIVDWIEAIPFRETRNYVMRVAESLPVYRARIAEETQELTLSEELQARN
ncbi:MAG: lytic transglycosylase domain-containing protein [Pseudomonadota bacterium]